MIPRIEETFEDPDEMSDPCGEDSHMPVPGLVHRYPDRVLLKAGPLNEEERNIIKLHPGVGARLLNQAQLMMGDSAYLKFGQEIALTHHEWFDGSGSQTERHPVRCGSGGRFH